MSRCSRLVNRAVLTVLALGLGLISVLMISADASPLLAGSQIRLLEVLGWFGLFGGTVLLLRVRAGGATTSPASSTLVSDGDRAVGR
jgi:hypothetical protein